MKEEDVIYDKKDCVYEAKYRSEETWKRRGLKEMAWKGVSFGSCLAMIISYTNWHSIFWAIVHGIFSWAYVIYFWIRY